MTDAASPSLNGRYTLPENPHPAAEHHPPSQPTSPLPKRVRMSSSSTAPVANAKAPTNYSDSPAIPTQSTANIDATSQLLAAPTPSAQAEDKSMSLQIKKLSDKARVPTRGSAYAAGYDLYASKETTIPRWGKAMVPTDISIAVPAGTYGRVAPRSGLASKHCIATGAGVIDLDYRGPVFVLLFNHSDADFQVNEGDRIAQLVLERIVTPAVEVVEELSSTERGAGGFGSTGGYGVSHAVASGIAQGVGSAAGGAINGVM